MHGLCRRIAFLVLLFVTMHGSQQVCATEPTPILQLPVRITESGSYALVGNLQFDGMRGAAIVIDVDNVAIDFGGQTISGLSDCNTLAIGVHAVGRRGISLSNGRITRFYFGIDIRPGKDAVNRCTGHVLSNLILDGNYYFGLRVAGEACEVRHCSITDTGGSARPGHTIPHGARLIGERNSMRDCKIIDLRLKRFAEGKGEIVGVHFDAAKDSVFERNHVIELTNQEDDVRQSGEVKPRRFGIWVNGGPDKNTFLTVRDNIFVGFPVAVAFAPGSDGRVTGNRFHDAADQPIRGRPAAQLHENTIVDRHASVHHD